jgi:hypothetical protein
MNSNPKLTERMREARAASHRPDDGTAFLPDPTGSPSYDVASMADGESFGEEFVASATAGEPVEMDAQDEVVEEEWGGPFLELDAESEASAGEAIPEPPGLHKLPPRLQ